MHPGGGARVHRPLGDLSPRLGRVALGQMFHAELVQVRGLRYLERGGRLPPPKTGRPSGGALEIREAQRLAGASKITKGFNTSDVPLEFMLLHDEIAESFQAWRRAQPDLGEELADVALYLFALAEMNGVAEFDLSVAEGAGTAPLSNSVSAERIVAELHPPGLHGGDSRQRSLLSPRTRLGGAVSSSTGS